MLLNLRSYCLKKKYDFRMHFTGLCRIFDKSRCFFNFDVYFFKYAFFW